MQRPLERAPPMMLPPGTRVRTRPSSPQGFPYHHPRQNGDFEGGEGTILPSIEGSDGAYLSPRAHLNPFDRHSEPRDTHPGWESGRSLRDVAFIDLAADSDGSTPKRRRLEEIPPLSQYRPGRRDSPRRPVERLYMGQAQPRPAHVENRIADYDEPRSSPRVRPAVSVADNRYVERQPLHDVRDLPNNVARSHQPMAAAHEAREMMNMQPRYYPQSHNARSRDDFEVTRPARDLDNPSSIPVSRVYEPIVESRGYDSRLAREYDLTVREQHVPPVSQDLRQRYIYPAGSNVRELQALPPQRVLEYDHRPAASTHPYAH